MSLEERNKQFQADKDKPIKQRTPPSLTFFDNSDILSDVSVTDSSTGKEYKSHKIILASRSNYFKEAFVGVDPQPTTVTLPKIVKSQMTKT